MVLTKISEKARQIPDFASLPCTAQISLLHEEIIEARQFNIPHAAICAVLNDVGSSVTVRYFRDVLFVLKNRKKIGGQHTKNSGSDLAAPKLIVKESITSSEKRQQKADFYTSSNNPLLLQLNKAQE